MSRQHARAKAFTIVEILVVVGIIALLLGMLLPALAGAQKRSAKHKELNALRQIGLGWTLYANANNGKLLPGYLDYDVQQRWRVKYEYPNRRDIPAGDIAGPWTWRLLPYLENNIATVHSYADETGYEIVTLDPSETQAGPADMETTATPIAFEPGFGYNAYYVGGWWTMGSGLARPLLYDAVIAGTSQPANVLSRSVGTIRRPTTLMIFCSASLLQPGLYRTFPANQPGSHYVVPPRLGAVEQWNSAGIGPGNDIGASAQLGGSSSALEVGALDPTTLLVYPQGGETVAAPIGRYNRLAAMLHADGHTDAGTPGSLTDMRKWIDVARTPDFRHE